MMHTFIRHALFLFGILAIGYATFFLFSEKYLAVPVEASAAHNVSGWAWSSNMGWISFNSKNCDANGDGFSEGTPSGCPPAGTAIGDYGVTVAFNGDMSGYAWSDNIGWISFNAADLASCPQTPCFPKINRSTGILSGWARACAGTVNGNCAGGPRTDGWDGWIHLRGFTSEASPTEYGVSLTGCVWDGYAWGSDVLGWIRFQNTSAPSYGVMGGGDGCNTSFDYSLEIFSPSIVVTPGTSDSNTIFAHFLQGQVTEDITFSHSGEPAGATVTYTNNPCSPECYTGITFAVPVGVPFGTYPITITGMNTSGLERTASFDLIVRPEIISFDADPILIVIGESSSLAWDISTGFTSCSIDQGVGAITPPSGSGSILVSPAAKTIYELSCTGPNGSDAKTVTITVLAIPEFEEIAPR